MPLGALKGTQNRHGSLIFETDHPVLLIGNQILGQVGTANER